MITGAILGTINWFVYGLIHALGYVYIPDGMIEAAEWVHQYVYVWNYVLPVGTIIAIVTFNIIVLNSVLFLKFVFYLVSVVRGNSMPHGD